MHIIRSWGLRKYPWSSLNKGKLLKFVGYTMLTLPLLIQALKGYVKMPDVAWFFHIPACWVILGLETKTDYLKLL